MPVFSIKVKWGKETFKDVQVDSEGDVIDFKAQLYALSNVPIERQKIMCGGKTLGDEWNIPLKNVRKLWNYLICAKSLSFVSLLLFQGAVVLLLGTCEELSVEPVQKTVFIEDMSESELAQAIELPAGLSNLGNTWLDRNQSVYWHVTNRFLFF